MSQPLYFISDIIEHLEAIREREGDLAVVLQMGTGGEMSLKLDDFAVETLEGYLTPEFTYVPFDAPRRVLVLS